MSEKKKQIKDETIICRVSHTTVQALDCIAKLLGVNRSEALRRLIPDLQPRE